MIPEDARPDELAEWHAIRDALITPFPVPRPDTLEGVLLRVANGRRAPLARRFWTLLRAQAPIVGRRVWAASALVLLIGIPVTLLAGARDGGYLALVAPAVAAAGIAFVYGPEADPSLELALATPTSPRLVLLARLTIVLGFDVLLALAASALLAAAGLSPAGFEALVGGWLGPMLMVSALSLCAAVRFGPAAGIGAGVGLWTGLMTMRPGLDGAAASAIQPFLATDVVTLGVAAALAVGLIVLLPRAALVPA
jgi:hypothetical protein